LPASGAEKAAGERSPPVGFAAREKQMLRQYFHKGGRY